MKHILPIATLVALVLAGLTTVTAGADDSKNVIVHAQGNAYHVNFASAASKRGDLRLNIAAKGVDAAFTQWLKSEHPGEYRQAIARTLTAGSQGETAVRFASSYCCAKDGGCCQSNCGQCCAKGNCTMGCCSMDACKKLRHACCK